MSTVSIKQYYSTRRKRDVVTGAAIVLFGILILFQLYITIVFPLQLRHQKFLILEMEKDEMYEQVDRIRDAIRRTRGKDFAQKGEVKLVEGILDQFALHVRENGKEMDLEQVTRLRTEMRRYELVILGWNYPSRRILYPEDTDRDVKNSLAEFFGDLDAGAKIDPDRKVSFEKYFKSNRDTKYYINQNELDTTPYARAIENSILNTH